MSSFSPSISDAFCREWLSGKEVFELTTSGSTGTPRKIFFRREQLRESAMATVEALKLTQGYTSLVCLDTRYVGGMMMLVRSMVAGMNMVHANPAANPFAQISEDTKIDFTALVPYQLKSILESPDRKRLNELKHVLIGGAPIDPKIENDIKDFKCQFYHTYGMTETISHIALRKMNGPDKSEWFCILPGIRIEQDYRNCLVIHAGYLPHPVITNDIIEMKGTDRFNWLGRTDRVINSGGVKLLPEAIEKKIEMIMAEMNIQTQFFIAGIPDHQLGESVSLIMEGRELTSDQWAVLEKSMKALLALYEFPRSVRYLEKFVYTATGKINRLETGKLVR